MGHVGTGVVGVRVEIRDLDDVWGTFDNSFERRFVQRGYPRRLGA